MSDDIETDEWSQQLIQDLQTLNDGVHPVLDQASVPASASASASTSDQTQSSAPAPASSSASASSSAPASSSASASASTTASSSTTTSASSSTSTSASSSTSTSTPASSSASTSTSTSTSTEVSVLQSEIKSIVENLEQQPLKRPTCSCHKIPGINCVHDIFPDTTHDITSPVNLPHLAFGPWTHTTTSRSIIKTSLN